MPKQRAEGLEAGWSVVDRERRLDRWVRRVCAGAWAVTLTLTACYAALIAREVLDAMRRRDVGAGSAEAVWAAATPLVIALGILMLLVAALSTVGMFLRFRTAAFSEIQLRLAALESMVSHGAKDE